MSFNAAGCSLLPQVLWWLRWQRPSPFPVRQYTSEPASEPTTIKIYTGAEGSFSLYEDDGISQDYLTGKYTRTVINWNDNEKKLTMKPVAGSNKQYSRRVFNIQLLPEGTLKTLQYAGKPVTVFFK